MAEANVDHSQRLADHLREAVRRRQPVRIAGADTKEALVGRKCEAVPLPMAEHRGIISYRPDEMVITARAGTPISELKSAVAERGQVLPGDVPEFGGLGTLGGTLASGLLGPARPWQGSLRDAVLGMRLIDGQGEILHFGGEVIKNVAGYDVSRFQAGGLGCFGLMLDVSLRLLPAPRARAYYAIPCTLRDAIPRMRRLCVSPLPLSGASWFDGELQLRFEGSPAALEAVSRRLDAAGEGAPEFWDRLREWQLPPQTPESMPWVLDLAPARADSADNPCELVDWGGARRWYAGTVSQDRAQMLAGRGGYAVRHGAGREDSEALPAPAAATRALLRRLKLSVDPHGILNPGRLYPWM